MLKVLNEIRQDVIIKPTKMVNKENYHISLLEFKQLLINPKCKFVFFNVEYSNVNFFTEKLNIDLNKNFIESYIEEVNKIKAENPQIMFTEFLLCKESKKEEIKFKLFPFLIPSLKFHKFKEQESLLVLDSQTLNYLNFLQVNYPLSSVCNSNTISYMNLKEREKIFFNYEKILEEGKPTKKENFKSYYFFPKNVLMPTNQTKLDLEHHIESIINTLRVRIDMINKETQTVDIEKQIIPVKNNFYVVDKLINFEWRKLINPFQKNMIRIDIDNCHIERNSLELHEDVNNSLLLFREFCTCLYKYLNEDFASNINNTNFTKDNFFIFKYDSNLINNNFFQLWRNFLEGFFEYKILIVVNFKKTEVTFNFRILKTSEEISSEHFNYLSELIKRLTNIFESEANCSFSEQSLFRKNKFLSVFNFYTLYPVQLHKYIDFTYHLNFEIYLQLFIKVNLNRNIPIKFDELFQNLHNETEILFDYELEKELFFFIGNLRKEIDNFLLDKSKKMISISDVSFLKDLNIFFKQTEFSSEIEKVFQEKIKITKVDEKKKELAFSFPNVNKQEIKDFAKYFKENETEIRYEMIKVFTKLKKHITFEEEFGTANFFNVLFESAKNVEDNKIYNYTLVGVNLLQKFTIVYLEMFSQSKVISHEEFLSFLANFSFIDLNCLFDCINKNFMQELAKISLNNNNILNCIKNFLIFKGEFLEKECEGLKQNSENKFIYKKLNNLIISDSKGEFIKKDSEKITDQRVFLLKKNEEDFIKIYKSLIELCQNHGDFMINDTLPDYLEISFISPLENREKLTEELTKFECLSLIKN